MEHDAEGAAYQRRLLDRIVAGNHQRTFARREHRRQLLIVVVLPAPLGARKAKMAPSGTRTSCGRPR